MRENMPNPIAVERPKFDHLWPSLGLGCAPLGDIFEQIPELEVHALLTAAWDGGVRYYDTAPWYGHGLSEHRLGSLLRQKDRRDFVISTKVGRVYEPAPRGTDGREKWLGGLNFSLRFDYTADGFAESVAQSQLRLGTASIDALVIHDLDAPHHGKAMDEHVAQLFGSGFDYLHSLKTDGAIAAVGMGINRIEEFTKFAADAPVDFFIVAMPYTLLDQGALKGPMARCIERGIRVIVGAPFASGLLTDPSRRDATYGYQPVEDQMRQKALAIEAVCRNHGVPLNAAALQFPLMHPAVVSVIPGATSAAHVRANVAAAKQPISAALWDELKERGLLDADAPTAAGA